MFNKKKKTSIGGSSIKRISSMELPALKSWFDNTLMNLGPTFDNYRYHGVAMNDVSDHLNVLNELWKEILQREDNQ